MTLSTRHTAVKTWVAMALAAVFFLEMCAPFGVALAQQAAPAPAGTAAPADPTPVAPASRGRWGQRPRRGSWPANDRGAHAWGAAKPRTDHSARSGDGGAAAAPGGKARRFGAAGAFGRTSPACSACARPGAEAGGGRDAPTARSDSRSLRPGTTGLVYRAGILRDPRAARRGSAAAPVRL